MLLPEDLEYIEIDAWGRDYSAMIRHRESKMPLAFIRSRDNGDDGIMQHLYNINCVNCFMFEYVPDTRPLSQPGQKKPSVTQGTKDAMLKITCENSQNVILPENLFTKDWE